MTDIKILLPQNKEAILELARAALLSSEPDEMEREMQSWTARWRGEALDHYLPQGWSFGAFDDTGKLLAAILAQPYLFHRGHTQTLWIEELLAPTGELAHALVETAYKWARDKHFQCVLAEDLAGSHGALRSFPRARTLDAPLLELPSARI